MANYNYDFKYKRYNRNKATISTKAVFLALINICRHNWLQIYKILMKHEFLRVEEMTDLFQFFIYTNMCRVSGFEFLGELHCISLLPPIFIFFFYIKINVNLQIKEINKCLLVFAVLLILRLNTQNVPYFYYIVKCKHLI